MSHPIPFLCTRYEDIVSRAVQQMKPLAGKQIFCSEFIALELWTSQPCSATAEDPESFTVSRSCIYHSLSGLPWEYWIYFFCENVWICVDLCPFSPTAQFIFSEFWLRNIFVSAQTEIHKYIFCYAVLMTFFLHKIRIYAVYEHLLLLESA